MSTHTMPQLLGWALLLMGPLFLHAAAPVQFIDGLWLSSDTLYPHEPVRVYVALRNSASVAISGSVTVSINDQELGTRPINALPGRLIESWIDWTPPSVGDYRITATLHDVVLEYPAGAESIPGTTATLTRESVMVTEPPAPATPEPGSIATNTASGTVATQAPRWYQTLTQRINDIHADLQAYENTLVARRDAGSRSTNSSNQTNPALRPASTTATTTTAGATMADIARHWLSNNLLATQLWVVKSTRWLFNYPVVVQLLLLLTILWTVYRTARYFGRR